MKRIVLFDGECNFCDKSVQFIIKRDPEARFKFTSLQSEVGENLLNEYHVPKEIDSLVLLEYGKYYIQSSAALRICKQLNGLWKVLYIFILVPRPIRDVFYRLIANNRYKWFGKKDSCMLPSVEDRKRFL